MRIAPTFTPSQDLSQKLSRYTLSLVALFATVAWGCNGTTETVGSIALSVTPSSETVLQGGVNTEATVSLTRSGGFTGAVNFNVTGAPIGVAANVTNVATTGAVTTAIVVIAVGATAAPGTYNLTVRADGEGVLEASATLALTVTAAPAVTLTLSNSALTVARGGTTTTTVNIARTNFTTGVSFKVIFPYPEWDAMIPPPQCLPPGITVAFSPNPATGVASVLTITAANIATAGTYQLLVVGDATDGPFIKSVFFDLTVT